MDKELRWELFRATGDPMAYVLYCEEFTDGNRNSKENTRNIFGDKRNQLKRPEERGGRSGG